MNPVDKRAILLVPKWWLRRAPWIGYEDYTANYIKSIVQGEFTASSRTAVLAFNRRNYDLVQAYVRQKERSAADCKNDPLFKPIPEFSAKRKLAELEKLPSGTVDKADKRYEQLISQILTSVMYPYLDFAAMQSRTESGVQIRDLIFYNNRSFDFLIDLHQLYESRQVVFELKNVAQIEREHINQLNRYLRDEFGKFGDSSPATLYRGRSSETPLICGQGRGGA